MTAIEDAQVRVARAEDVKAKLQKEAGERYGSIETMSSYAKSAGPGGKKAAELRKRYNQSVKELKLAKDDLLRMRSEEQQKAKLVVPPPSNAFEEKLIEVSREQGIEVEIKDRPAYMEAMDQAAEKAEASRTTSIVISDKGVSLDGGAPVPKEAVLAAIDVVKGRKKVQMDLEGKKATAPLSGRIKVPPERFELETPSFIIRGNKEEVQDLVREGSRESVRRIVQQRLRIKKDAIVPDGEFDRMVERFVDEIMRGILNRLPEDE